MCQENEVPPNQNGFSSIIDRRWLEKYAPELINLPKENETALLIKRFTFYWMIFEGKALIDRTERDNPKKIEGICKEWVDFNLKDLDNFCCAWDYFYTRYVNNERFDALFDSEESKKSLTCKKLKKILDSKGALNKHDKALGVLLVVYRYRNRLFHGPKWIKDHLGNQFENFKCANCVLRCAIKLWYQKEYGCS